MKKLFLLLLVPFLLNARGYKNPFCDTITTLNLDLIKSDLKKIEESYNKNIETIKDLETKIAERKAYVDKWGKDDPKSKDKLQEKENLEMVLKQIKTENLALVPCDDDNLTPLHLVCRYGTYFTKVEEGSTLEKELKNIIDKMIKLGADINAKTNSLQETPIDEIRNCKKDNKILKNAVSEHYKF